MDKELYLAMTLNLCNDVAGGFKTVANAFNKQLAFNKTVMVLGAFTAICMMRHSSKIRQQAERIRKLEEEMKELRKGE